jgi:hypothetical protein
MKEQQDGVSLLLFTVLLLLIVTSVTCVKYHCENQLKGIYHQSKCVLLDDIGTKLYPFTKLSDANLRCKKFGFSGVLQVENEQENAWYVDKMDKEQLMQGITWYNNKWRLRNGYQGMFIVMCV